MNFTRLLINLLNGKNSLLIGTGLLAYVTVSIFLIASGLPKEVAMELGCAAGGGSAALIAFVDSWLGISSSILRMQKDRQLREIQQDLQSGIIGPTQALETVIRQQLLTEIQSIPWYDFAERARVKESAANRYWAVKHVLPYTISSLSNRDLDDLCVHLYQIEVVVAQNRQRGGRLPSIEVGKEIAEQAMNQRLLP
jgi:hypothetical protein